jgi:hypothetical protein
VYHISAKFNERYDRSGPGVNAIAIAVAISVESKMLLAACMSDVANRLSIMTTAATRNTTRRRSCELIIDFVGVAEPPPGSVRHEQRYGSVIDFDNVVAMIPV